MEVAGRGLEPSSLPLWRSGAAGKEGLGAGRCGAGTPGSSLPSSLTVLPLQGAKPKQGRECEEPRFSRRARV